MAVLFRLLGDVDAQVDGTSLALGPSLRRTVFAVLAVKVDQVVPVDVLIDRVWGTGAPPRAHSSLYSYVTRLRATLAGSGADIVRRGNGYLLAADEMSIDLHRFRDLVRQARDEDDARAAKFYEEASALWQGDPFAGLESSWLAEQRAALEQERHAAFLDSVDVRIRLGRHAEVVAELSDAGAEHPLDERLAAQAVLALHRGGQRADALRRYREISDRLRDELGVDPGEALRSLHHRVLTEDPELTAHPVPAARVVVPRQLPPAPRHFVGRADELRALSAALLPDEAEGTPIALVSGTGGLGKTSLA
ncbi:AfsR/SARP family transcriptional regulator, partial [Umezawaea endophytica]